MFVAILFLMGSAAYGQGIAIGPKAGFSISSFRGTNIDNIDNRAGGFGGVFVNLQLSPAFTIQPEFILTQRGADFTENNVRRNLRVNYFEVPVLLKLRATGRETVFPHLLVGPNFSFRTNVNYSASDNSAGGTTITTNDTDVSKSDVGALVGAGIDFETPNSGIMFTIDGRYGFGFNNVRKDDGVVELRNVGWYFSAGLGFLIKQ
jgi:hypothetical protein